MYVCAASNTLSSGDLVPNTSGDMDAEPTRQITRTPLHNGLDFVSLGNLQSQDFTIKAFLADNNTKLQEIKTALKNGDAMKMNIFFRDGSGVKGYAYVTRIRAGRPDRQRVLERHHLLAVRRRTDGRLTTPHPAPNTGGGILCSL